LAIGDPNVALLEFQRCRALSARHGVSLFDASSAVGMAVAHSLLDDEDSNAAFADAITLTFTERNWGHLLRAIASTANHFARHGRQEPAAVLLGYLHDQRSGNALPGDTSTDRSFLEQNPSAAQWIATGAEMSTESIVRYALTELRQD
jgi:hypothetical protein